MEAAAAAKVAAAAEASSASASAAAAATAVATIADDPISLKVLGQDNTMITFKLKRSTLMKTLIDGYCKQAGGLEAETLRFRFDGISITGEDTADSLELQDDDTIEVYQVQTGGGFS